jgi:hypothetical protein
MHFKASSSLHTSYTSSQNAACREGQVTKLAARPIVEREGFFMMTLKASESERIINAIPRYCTVDNVPSLSSSPVARAGEKR